jgi:hypothetical protein
MFKHYLTYGFAESFLRSCSELKITTPIKDRLVRSAEGLLEHLGLAANASGDADASKELCVALFLARDCGELLDEAGLRGQQPIGFQFTVVHSRLERLCLQAANLEGGQIRLLG